MTGHFENKKNELGITKSSIELDNNHNQVNSKTVIDLMATRDDEVSQFCGQIVLK
jgi:hypothetical protein